MTGKKEYQEINGLLDERLREKGFLIAVHRGVWRANIIENTYLAFMLSEKLGGDMFEVDLSNSTDGEIYMFHDGGERRIFGIEKNIKTLSSREIDSLEARNSLGEPSARRIERFSSLLERLDGRSLFNIDRSWWFLPDVDRLMQQHPERIRQGMIKTHVVDEYLDFFRSCPRKYMYMPIVATLDEQEKVLSGSEGINLVGMELIASSPDDEIISEKNIRMLRERNLFIWINTITLGAKKEHILSGGYDDDRAIEQGPDSSWGVLLDRGVNVLQTDWPSLMREYREGRR